MSGCCLAVALVASVAAYLWFRDRHHLGRKGRPAPTCSSGRLPSWWQAQGRLASSGGIWLPLPHLLIDAGVERRPVHLGPAGSVFSMLAYVATVLRLYGAVRVATRDRLAGWVAATVYGLNLPTRSCVDADGRDPDVRRAS